MVSMRTRKVKEWKITWDSGNMSILERRPGKESRN
jgi:hypothetical protein